jgi:hypothetical protein
VKIYLSDKAKAVETELRYLFKLLAINQQTTFELIDNAENAFPSIGTEENCTIRLSPAFVRRDLQKEDLNAKGLFEFPDGSNDNVSTAFFYLNSCQEFTDNDRDELGRFRYKNSLQRKYNIVLKNVVQVCFNDICSALRLRPTSRKTSFFLSHDIDTIYGAIKEDGFNVLKKGRIDLFLKMLFNVAAGKPGWLNIDRIMKIESEYDCRSTFFWIVNQGKIDPVRINADYKIDHPVVRKALANVRHHGFENGLHKSLSADSFTEEMRKLGSKPVANRYHYLKFNLPAGYEAIEQAELSLDASLGFSEQWGFRNNYGLPFNPFNFKTRAPFSFVEVPLHIMDRTFFNRRMGIGEVEKEVFNFFEMNRTDSVLSVLWHNNFFTDYKYKGYLSLYKKILSYIKENNFATLTQDQIIKTYGISWP